MGNLQMNEIPKKISDSDCLVLPSHFDGWGAVVSEALMVGTPVICSDNCGSSVVVRSSKFGYIFQNNNSQDLYLKLKKMINKGKISRKKRAMLNKWARCLGAKSGADYLIKILQYSSKIKKKPIPPWKIKR
jgi:glycosyltransferase involved in cell wall biosynthesis